MSQIAPSPAAAYPAELTGRLDEPLSRWLWLVKWFLAIPHLVVLAVLWLVFVLLTIFAFVAILFTGRYPAQFFAVNLGIMRWTWRVSFYAFSVIGTDRYPPFTLEDVADYPARLIVAEPPELSRGLVLVKWWLLAIPQYLIVASFTGANPGLRPLLAIYAALALLFTGRYPQGIFDFILGLERWTFRVMTYAALMHDVYPPFRLDLGGTSAGEG